MGMEDKRKTTVNKRPLADFTQGSILQKMLTFAAPLFLSQVLQAVYNLVDMIVVGQYIGKVGLSAVSIGGDLQRMLTFAAMGFSNAGQILLSQNIGAGNRTVIRHIVGNLFTFLLGISSVLSIFSIIFHTPMLGWMNTPAEAWDYASDYMLVCSCGLVFIYGYNAVSAILRGMGDSRHPFIFVATAAVLNVALDLLFVIVWDMAALGAALATVISQGVSFLLGLRYLYRNREVLRLSFDRNSFRPHREAMIPMVRLGVPMALKSASVTFSKLFVDAWINSYGLIASSASGIESKINVICNLFANAINVSCSTMIGQNVGARKFDRVPKVMRSAFLVVLSVDLLLSATILFFPQFIFRIFTQDVEVLEAATTMIPVLLLIFLGSAARSPNNGLIDGTGNYKLNFAVAILDGILARIGFSLLFGLVLDMGWIGFLYGDAVAGFTPLFIGGVYYLSGKWRTDKYLMRR